MSRRLAQWLIVLALAGCSSSSSAPPPDPIACSNDPVLDSQLTGGATFTRIDSSASTPAPTYGVVTTRYESDGTPVIMPYMLHQALDGSSNPITGKALVLLIAGGQLTAKLVGNAGTGIITSAGGNFLVRSAHLFARQGYRVVTIDQPSDTSSVWNPISSPAGYAMDGYRISPSHAVDLVKIIQTADPARGLPVIIAGTSRGTISAVAQTRLADALALSAPLTVGSGPTSYPIVSAEAKPANVTGPAQVLWHVLDQCSKSPVNKAWSLAQDLVDGTGTSVDGGFVDPTDPINFCGAFSHHGFLGIESCAVGQHTTWMDGQTLVAPGGALPAHNETSAGGADVVIDLSGEVPVGGSIVLPHATSALGGSLSLVGSMLTYTPPGITGTTDTFVYVIRSSTGALQQGVVTVTLNP